MHLARIPVLAALLFVTGLRSTAYTVEAGALELSRFFGSPFPHSGPPATFTNIVAVTHNSGTVLALRDDGTVAPWGDQSWLVPDLTNVAAIALGYSQGVALSSNGTVRAWGSSPGWVPFDPNLTSIQAIAAGGNFGLALRSNGRVVGWGDNTHKQLRIPRHKFRRARAIACGGSHALALTADGRVVAWGENSFKQTAVPRRLRGVKAIAAGSTCSLALREDGTVVAWGDNRYGQTNVPPDLTNVVAIAAGFKHCLALKGDGTVVGWGSSDQLGTAIVPAGLTHVTGLSAGFSESFFITKAPIIALAYSATFAYLGERITFETRFLSSSPVRLQWRRNGGDIPGATNALLVIPRASFIDAGTYSLWAENDFGSRTLSTAPISVLAPSLYVSPTNQTEIYGKSARFSASVTGPEPWGFLWYFNGQLIPGANQSSLSVIAAHTNAGLYHAVALTSNGSLTSNPAILNVHPAIDIAPATWLEGDIENVQYVTVTATAPFATNLTIHYTFTGSPSVLGGAGQIVLPAGATNAFIPVNVSGDLIREPEEHFTVTIRPFHLTYRSSAVVTIQNDDAVPLLTLTYFDAPEGHGISHFPVVHLQLSAAATNEVSLRFETRDGTALAGRDYAGTNGIVRLAPGTLTQSIALTFFGDLLLGELHRTFDILLSNPSNAFFTNASVLTVRIQNDDTLQLHPDFTASLVATGLYLPTTVVAMHDGVLVCEQTGRVLEFKTGSRRTVLELNATTEDLAEAGLLGLALDPDFHHNRFFYVYYTPSAGFPRRNRISRFTYDATGPAQESEQILLDLDPLFNSQIHNGGGLKFGPDGKLYVGVGESGRADHSQNLSNVLGKILRLNADGSIPEDNPFYATATGKNRAIWALGLRNPWRFDFEPGSGQMLINDVGQSSWEEINEGMAGANYGWPRVEGWAHQLAFTDPLFAYSHDNLVCSITGGAFVGTNNPAFPPEFSSTYFFSDLCGGFIRRLDTSDGTVHEFASGVKWPIDLHTGPDGALFLVYRPSWYEGAVLRLEKKP